MTANHLEEALADFLKAGELAEENQFAWANVACVYKNEAVRGAVLYKKAISLMESEPTTYFYETLGRHLYLYGRRREGVRSPSGKLQTVSRKLLGGREGQRRIRKSGAVSGSD